MTIPTATTICIYPLSPPYALIHRYLYYTTLTLSILYPTPPPLIKGAFAYTLTYSSTTALYAILILSIKSPTILNLDIFGLWSILAPTTITILPLLLWNKNLLSSSGRSSRLIARFWGVLMVVATIGTFVLLKRAPPSTPETCSTGTMKLKLRDPKDAEIVLYSSVFHPLFKLMVDQLSALVFVPTTFGIITCLVDISPDKKDQAEMLPEITIDNTKPAGTYLPSKTIGRAFNQLRKVVASLTPLMFIPVIVVNEMFLLRDEGIPVMEGAYEIGQWGLIAGLGFVALAGFVDEIVGKGKAEVMEVDRGCRGVDSGVIQEWKRGNDVY